jgi:hypothetical protein
MISGSETRLTLTFGEWAAEAMPVKLNYGFNH